MTAGLGSMVVMLTGAFLFAGSNVVAKAIYSGGMSQTALFIVRGIVVYAMNGALEGLRYGSASAQRVLALRVGNSRLAIFALLRSFAGFAGISLLNISFQMMHLADAFALTLGVMTLSTVLLARVCIGGAERLSARALFGGILAMVGIVCVTQPEAVFGDGRPPKPSGVAIAISAGGMLSIFNVLTRVLGKAGASALSPSMLLSYYMVVVGGGSLVVALVVAAAGPRAHVPAWATFELPARSNVWALVLLYCLGILSGQLLLAKGYSLLPAGFASILGLTELCFSWCVLQCDTHATRHLHLTPLRAKTSNRAALHPARRRPAAARTQGTRRLRPARTDELARVRGHSGDLPGLRTRRIQHRQAWRRRRSRRCCGALRDQRGGECTGSHVGRRCRGEQQEQQQRPRQHPPQLRRDRRSPPHRKVVGVAPPIARRLRCGGCVR